MAGSVSIPMKPQVKHCSIGCRLSIQRWMLHITCKGTDWVKAIGLFSTMSQANAEEGKITYSVAVSV